MIPYIWTAIYRGQEAAKESAGMQGLQILYIVRKHLLELTQINKSE